MANDYYTPTGNPAQGSDGSSAEIRSESSAVEAGFGKLPPLSGNGNEIVFVNNVGTALVSLDVDSARTLLGLAETDTPTFDSVTATDHVTANIVNATTAVYAEYIILGTNLIVGTSGIDETELSVLDGAIITNTQLNHLFGVTSNIQDQLDTLEQAILALTP